MQHKFKATAPAKEVKTKRDYFWLLPNEFDKVVPLILNHTNTGFNNYKVLNKSLRSFFSKQVLAKADVPMSHAPMKMYNMRTLRAYRATEWMNLVAEYKIMRWEPLPPNPLQHETDKTTKENYALQGSGNELQARKRICEKYYDNEALR